MTVLFWVRKNYVNTKGTCQIKCTISISGESDEFATQLHIKPVDWNQKRQKAKGDDALYINDTLKKISARLIDIKRNFERMEKSYTPTDVKNAYLNKVPLQLDIQGLYKLLIDSKKNKILGKTLEAYEPRMKNIIKAIGNILIQKLEFKHLDSIVEYFINEGFKNKTIRRHLGDLDTALRIALRKGYKFDEKILSYKPDLGIEQSTPLVYLNEEELELLREVSFKDSRLENVRKLFLLQTYLSCSYNELKRIMESPEQFIEGDLVIIDRQKTKRYGSSYQIIPYQKDMQKLLFEQNIKIISNQKYNQYIKDVMKELKINKRVTTHTARKSGGNELLRKGFDMVEVQKILGHKKIQVTVDNYVEITKDIIRNKSKQINKNKK